MTTSDSEASGLQIVFVIQAGELAIKALLLGSTLRHKLGQGVRLVAACPQHAEWGDLSAATLAVLRQLNIELVPFIPSFAPEYPIGNKIDALALLEEGRPSVFLDSDMLCLTSFTAEQLLPDSARQRLSIAAKPADLATWGSDEQWQLLQRGMQLPVTPLRLHCTVDGQLNRPYYNAGLVATCHPRQLARLWREQCDSVRALPHPPEPLYPWLDQIGLAVCAQYHVAQRITLSERWNFPAHLRALPDAGRPKLCHYHSPGVILREPRLLAVVRQAAARYPHIASLMRSLPDWQLLLRPRLPQLRAKSLQGRDFLITGIPRSGTSLLCKLLGQQANWLILNEPPEVIPYLRERPDASGIGLLHRQYRERILRGQPIENKIRNGEMIEDTAQGDERQLYHAPVQGRYFRMGSKNTLAYLASLGDLQKLGWPIVAMIRHPLDSLASWENTFNHLREASPEQLPLTHADFYGWAGWQRAALDEIACQSDATLRRVLLWRLLAQTLLAQPGIHLWFYEALVARPRDHVRQLRRELGAYAGCGHIDRLKRRQHDHQNNPHRDMIGDLCSHELQQLGYHL